MWSSLVTMARRASTHSAGRPACRSAAATIRELRSSPIAATTSSVRGETSRSTPSARTIATSWSSSSEMLHDADGSRRPTSGRALPPDGDRAAAPRRAAPRPTSQAPAPAAIARSASVTPLIADTTTAGPAPIAGAGVAARSHRGVRWRPGRRPTCRRISERPSTDSVCTRVRSGRGNAEVGRHE